MQSNTNTLSHYFGTYVYYKLFTTIQIEFILENETLTIMLQPKLFSEISSWFQICFTVPYYHSSRKACKKCCQTSLLLQNLMCMTALQCNLRNSRQVVWPPTSKFGPSLGLTRTVKTSYARYWSQLKIFSLGVCIHIKISPSFFSSIYPIKVIYFI